MTFCDFFAGCGGFRRGMELAGHECVGFCEIDRFATAAYTSMHLITEEQRAALSEMDVKQREKEILKDEYRNGEWYADDISRVYAGDIPRADCWCFGFPCTDISVAGRQEGLAGNRSGLFYRVLRLLEETPEEERPHTLFIENVKNLLSVNGGWDYARVLSALDATGYDAEWQVLNSKDFGVPQNRERVFVIGHLRGRSAAEVFPIQGADGQNRVEQIGRKPDRNRDNPQHDRTYLTSGLAPTLNCMEGGNKQPNIVLNIKEMGQTTYMTGNSSQNSRIYAEEGVSPTLKATDYKEPKKVAVRVTDGAGIQKVGMNVLGTGKTNQRSDVLSAEGISTALDATQYKEPKRVAIPVLTPDRAEKRQNGRRFKEDGDPAFTLTAQDRHGVAVGVRTWGIYSGVSKDFQRGPYPDASRCLKANASDACVAMEVGDAAVLRPCRTEYGKEIRKDYEAGRLDISRHDFLGYERREDGASNTLTTVQKDNLVSEEVGGLAEGEDGFVTLQNGVTAYAKWYPKENCHVVIRRLTPRECFRLQGWTDDYFDKAAFVCSDSQLYKISGNGVTVPVIYEIARRLK